MLNAERWSVSSILVLVASPHGSAPKMPDFQVQLVGVDAHLLQVAGDAQGVARRGQEHRGLVVLHDVDLPLHVARLRGGDDRGAHLLRAVMEAEPAGEHVVIKGDLDEIVVRDAGRRQHAGHQLGPVEDIVPGVADRDRPPGPAGRGMDADDVAEGNGEHVVRIALSQIVLGGEGEPARCRRCS